MRILIINSRYFLTAGPDKYLFGLTQILTAHGHEVIPFSTKNSKNFATEYERYFAEPIGGADKVYFQEYDKKPGTIIQMVERQFYSYHVKKRLDMLIKATRPDVAYVLHHANKLSPSVIDACKENRLPVVMRLSDFTLVCPNEHLYRDGTVCEECIAGSLWNGVRHRCVKKSLAASTVKVLAMSFHRLMRFYDKVDFVVSPSRFTTGKVATVLDRRKIVHIPTFIIKSEEFNPHLGDYVLHVGRIEEHKGILNAIKAVEGTDLRLKIVGQSSTGYETVLQEYIKAHGMDNVKMTGARFGGELRKLYREARCVVIPTLWYENLPNVALEAMMHSKPLVAPRLGSLRDIVKDRYNGLLYAPDDLDDLRAKLALLATDDKLCQRLAKNSYHEAVTVYDPEKHYKRLMRVFRKVVA